MRNAREEGNPEGPQPVHRRNNLKLRTTLAAALSGTTIALVAGFMGSEMRRALKTEGTSVSIKNCAFAGSAEAAETIAQQRGYADLLRLANPNLNVESLESSEEAARGSFSVSTNEPVVLPYMPEKVFERCDETGKRCTACVKVVTN